MRLSRVAFASVLAASILRFAARYPDLPATVASHFGADGKADGWMSKGAFAAFSTVPLVSALLVVFLGPFLVKKLPVSLINLPHKEYWLSPERKAQTVADFAARMEWFGTALLGFFVFVYELVFTANTGGGGRLAEAPFLAGLAAFLVFAAAWMVGLYRRFRRPPA